MKYQIPRHGCARCIWWRDRESDGWGRCICYAGNTYFRHAPCDEYVMNPEAEEEIEVILKS